MRISIWQQFSSNNSSDFTVVGIFDTPEAAQRAVQEVQQIIQTLNDWYESHPDEGNEILSSGGYPPSPAEVEMGRRFGFEWEQAVEWYQYASIEVVLDKLVYVTTKGFRPDTAGEPFDKVLTGLGGQGLLHGNSYGEQLGTILAEITAEAPDVQTAQSIADHYLDFERLSRANGKRLHFYDWNFREFDLPEVVADLETKGCTDINYRLYQSDDAHGNMRGPQDVDLLIKLLSTSPFYDVDRIARLLGEYGNPQAVEPLIEALQRPALSLEHIQIASALGNLRDQRAVEPLIQLLGDEAIMSAAHVAAASLAEIGDPRAIQPLVAALRNERAYDACANALASFGDAARQALRAASTDPDPVFHSKVELALQRLDEWGQGGEQFAALRSQNLETRGVALDKAKAEKNVELLIAYVRNPVDIDTLNQVIDTLADIGDPRAVEPLMSRMLNVGGRVFSALEKIGAPSVEPLIQHARNEQAEPWTRDSAIYSLTRIADPRALDVFIEFLGKSRDPSIVRVVAMGLAQIGDERAIEPLVNAFLRGRAGSRDFNYDLIEPLEKLNALERLIEPLLTAVATPSWSLSTQAMLLAKIGDKRAIEPLRNALSHGPLQFQESIRDALRQLGDEPET